MSIVFMLDGNKIFSIPLDKDATKENKEYWIDKLAKEMEVSASEIETKVVYN